jgi:hypothetical protein
LHCRNTWIFSPCLVHMYPGSSWNLCILYYKAGEPHVSLVSLYPPPAGDWAPPPPLPLCAYVCVYKWPSLVGGERAPQAKKLGYGRWRVIPPSGLGGGGGIQTTRISPNYLQIWNQWTRVWRRMLSESVHGLDWCFNKCSKVAEKLAFKNFAYRTYIYIQRKYNVAAGTKYFAAKGAFP